MMTSGLPVLKAWRSARSISLDALASQSGLDTAVISAIEAGEKDYTGNELQALASAFGCTPSGLLNGPSPPVLEAGASERRLLAQMLRDLCAEAVTAFDDMDRLEELKIAAEADEFWLGVADLFSESVISIRQARALDASSVPLETTPQVS
jgi:transcriptional regulator with XRE-family HTH domain